MIALAAKALQPEVRVERRVRVVAPIHYWRQIRDLQTRNRLEMCMQHLG